LKKVYEVRRCLPDCLLGESYHVATFTNEEEAKKLRELLMKEHPDWRVMVIDYHIFDSVEEYLNYTENLKKFWKR